MKKIVFTCLLSSIITGCGSDSSSSSDELTAFENQLINDFGVELNDIRAYCNSDAISCYLNDSNEPIAKVISNGQVGWCSGDGGGSQFVQLQAWNIANSNIDVEFVEYFNECTNSPSASEFISYQFMQNESYLEAGITKYTIPRPIINDIATENSTQFVGLKSTLSITPEVINQEQIIEMANKHTNIYLYVDDIEFYFTGATTSAMVSGNLNLPLLMAPKAFIAKTWGI